jgi:hypothetical protein
LLGGKRPGKVRGPARLQLLKYINPRRLFALGQLTGERFRSPQRFNPEMQYPEMQYPFGSVLLAERRAPEIR